MFLRSDELGRGEIGWFAKPFNFGRYKAVLLIHDGNDTLTELDSVLFRGMPFRSRERVVMTELDFAYVLPVTEIQAGRWPHVLLIDEMPLGDPARPGWLYSAFLAAETSLTIIRKHKPNT